MKYEDVESRLRAIPRLKMTPKYKDEVLQALRGWQHAGNGSNRQLRKPMRYVYPVLAAATFLSVVSVGGFIYHEHSVRVRASQAAAESPTSQSVAVVKRMIDAWNKQDWATVQSCVVNVLPVPMPRDNFQRKAAAGVNDFTITHVTQGTPYILHDWRAQPADLASDSNYSHHYSEAVAVPIRAVIMGKWTNETFHCVPDNHGQWKVAYDFLNNFEFWDVPYGTDARTNSTS